MRQVGVFPLFIPVASSILTVCLFVCLVVSNATFNNISAISWRSVLLVHDTEVT